MAVRISETCQRAFDRGVVITSIRTSSPTLGVGWNYESEGICLRWDLRLLAWLLNAPSGSRPTIPPAGRKGGGPEDGYGKLKDTTCVNNYFQIYALQRAPDRMNARSNFVCIEKQCDCLPFMRAVKSTRSLGIAEMDGGLTPPWAVVIMKRSRKTACPERDREGARQPRVREHLEARV